MAFSRSHRQFGNPDAPQGRDRHAIVGLSGWLFADLLLAVAVVFLVAETTPVGGEELRIEPELEVLVPVGIHDADLGPAGDFDRAALERSVDIGGGHIQHLCTEEIGEEGVIDGVAAYLEALHIEVTLRVGLHFLG